MSIGIVGIKRGMTRIFTDAGASVPVTVIECEPNRITCIKTADTDGYRAIQVTVGEAKPQRLSKAELGHFKASGVAPGRAGSSSRSTCQRASRSSIRGSGAGGGAGASGGPGTAGIPVARGTTPGGGIGTRGNRRRFSKTSA